ncbi:MAG: hypothetical protein ACAH17_02855 [Candidatus Paceibacterota bacterium]
MKAILISLLKKVVAMWKSYMDGLIDRNDKSNLIGDIVILGFLGEMIISAAFGWVVVYAQALTLGSLVLSFLGALSLFVIPMIGAAYAVVFWESGKYVHKNGLVGYKHNRRTT